MNHCSLTWIVLRVSTEVSQNCSTFKEPFFFTWFWNSKAYLLHLEPAINEWTSYCNIHNQVFPNEFFFPIALHSKNIWHRRSTRHTCRYFSAPRCTEFLKHINSSFWPNLINHSRTNSFLNGGVPFTRYSHTGTLKKNGEYNLFIRKCKFQFKTLMFFTTHL